MIAAVRRLGAAMQRLAAQLLLADEGECGAKRLVLDNRGLRDWAQRVEGPIASSTPR
jgi:hypothetical protein